MGIPFGMQKVNDEDNIQYCSALYFCCCFQCLDFRGTDLYVSMQVVKRSSTDDEDSVTAKGDSDKRKKKVAQSSSEVLY